MQWRKLEMPPKPKFTPEEIVDAALKLVRERGVDALTARELGARLGTSSRPIFTAFKGMDEVKAAVKAKAAEHFKSYTENFTDFSPAFKKMGMMMVSFAIDEPMLYRLLFMQESAEPSDFREAFADIGLMAEENLAVLQNDYLISPEQAKIMLDNLWIYSFGIGALCAMKVCTFTEDEIAAMLGRSFRGMMMLIKSDKIDVCNAKTFDFLPKEKSESTITR